MNTRVLHYAETTEQEVAHAAASLLSQGALVIFPTETVYGIGADAKNPEAIKKIYEVKGRPNDNPLIIHIADASLLAEVASEVSEEVKKLMQVFSPGPLTFILPRHPSIPLEATGGRDTVAVRIPAHPLARRIIEEAQTPIAAPSANRSGRPSGTDITSLLEDFDGKVPLIIDGGPSSTGIESTVIRVTTDEIVILRPGAISLEMLKAHTTLTVRYAIENDSPDAPGMQYRHYAPKAQMHILEDGEQLSSLVATIKEEGKSVAVLVFDEDTPLPGVRTFSIGSKQAHETYAARLYAHLRAADREGVDVIMVPAVSEEGIGKALMDRIYKAVKG